MALTRTDQYNAASLVAGASQLVAQSTSFNPGNNSLIVVLLGVENEITPQAVTFTATDNSAGGPLIWTNRLEVAVQNLGSYVGAASIWTAPLTTGLSLQVTAGCTQLSSLVDPGNVLMQIVSYTGYNIASPIGGTITNNTAGDGALTITLGATPAATSEVLAIRFREDNGTQSTGATPGTGWTQVFTVSTASPGYGDLQSQFRNNSTLTSVIWDDTSSNAAASSWMRDTLGIEIKAADITTTLKTRKTLLRVGI